LSWLFIQRNAYNDALKMDASAVNGAAGADPVTLPSRGLFSSVVRVMRDIARETGWGQYMTGTAFTITHFPECSPLLASFLLISADKRLTVGDMREVLQFYWDMPDAVLNDSRIFNLLKQCEGRPLFFAEIIFRGVYSHVSGKAKAGVPVTSFKVEALAPVLERRYSSLRLMFVEQMKRFLARDTRLLPRLVRALVFRTHLSLEGNDVLKEAVENGLIPASATDVSAVNPPVIDISAEPLVLEALTAAVDDSIKRDHIRIVRTLAEVPDEAGAAECGFAAVRFVAIDLALRTRQFRLRDPAAYADGVPLTKLLAQLYIDPGPNKALPKALSELKCRAERAVNMADWDARYGRKYCGLRRFIKAEVGDLGELDDGVILYNLPTAMGADVALLVRDDAYRSSDADGGYLAEVVGAATAPAVNRALERKLRLVMFQVKNIAGKPLSEALRTLHPGTQYLDNEQRDKLIEAGPDALGSNFVGSPARSDWAALSVQMPQLARDWVRVVAVARPVSPDVYEVARDIADGKSGKAGKKGLSGQLEEAARSPVVVLSLNSAQWLDESTRKTFVAASESVMGLPRSKRVWRAVPVPAAEAARAVDAAAAAKAARAAEAVDAAEAAETATAHRNASDEGRAGLRRSDMQ